ncbi:MAG: primosomal protein N' (replication factor Y), partial [Sphingobacteriales bacterium]
SIKHKFRPTLEPCARLLGIELRKHFGSRILGPEYPPTARVRNQYIQNILIKLERENINLKAAKDLIVSTIDEVKFNPNYRSCRFVIDVDPA